MSYFTLTKRMDALESKRSEASGVLVVPVGADWTPEQVEAATVAAEAKAGRSRDSHELVVQLGALS